MHRLHRAFDDTTNKPFASVASVTVANNIIRHAHDIAVESVYNSGPNPVSDGNSVVCYAFSEL